MLRTSGLAVAVVLVTIGCGGSPSGPTGSSGTLNLRITDSPYGSAKAVLVTFSEVSMHHDGDWETVPFADGSTSTWTCDLKKLQNAAQDLLGTGPLDAGKYTMVRLMVQSATIYFDNSAVSPTPCARSIPEPGGDSAALTIPSGEVKLNGEFALTPGEATTILIDFDGEQSIRETGNGTFMMNPVVRVVSVQ